MHTGFGIRPASHALGTEGHFLRGNAAVARNWQST